MVTAVIKSKTPVLHPKYSIVCFGLFNIKITRLSVFRRYNCYSNNNGVIRSFEVPTLYFICKIVLNILSFTNYMIKLSIHI